ncbi:DEKNAAC102015 [Brettanomyces naardenensis]|uniref:DEKNAAC102015 n=1 Tax=Brettanomyces naardenensis TaxID=13370 RepID=A0A448YJQ8_BRENA|nr:DEKNAAC102015 [Brettanomyces naardenensis]
MSSSPSVPSSVGASSAPSIVTDAHNESPSLHKVPSTTTTTKTANQEQGSLERAVVAEPPVLRPTKPRPQSKGSEGHSVQDKKGRSTSCYLCQRRKQKCDQRFPSCTNCIKAHVKCVQPPRYGETSRAHVKDDYTILLEKKVKQLEKLLDQTTRKISQLEEENSGKFTGVGNALPTVEEEGSLESSGSEDSSTKGGNTNTSTTTSPSSNSTRSETSRAFDSSKVLKYRKIGDLLDTSQNTARSYLPYDQFELVLNKPYEYFMIENAERVKKSFASTYRLLDFLRYEPVFDIDEGFSKQLIDIYFSMLQYKFPLLNEQEVNQFHHDYYRRKTFSNHVDYHFRCARMFLIFSISSLLYQATGRYRGPHPYRFVSSALRHMVFFHGLEHLKKVEILVLLCELINRTDKDSNCVYMVISDAMKLCIQLNLHKPRSYRGVSATVHERHLRCFWCAYILERSISVAVAKPFILKESKVDRSLPLFDEDNGKQSSKSAPSFINQAIKIRRIEAQFVEDLNILSSASIATRAQLPKVQVYFQELQEWRKECQGFPPGKETETLSVYYYRAVRSLIQPFLELLDADDKLFKECQAAAGQICQAIKAFHQKTVSGHSILNIHTAFTSGVTLIYCLWLERNRDDMRRKLMGDDKKHTRPLVSAALFSGLDDLRACSISLYVMAERTKFALSFRDSFDELMHATVDNLILRCGPNSSEILNYAERGMPPAVYRQPVQHYLLDPKFTQKTAAEAQEDEERTKRTGHLTRLAISKGLNHLLLHSPVTGSPHYHSPSSPLTQTTSTSNFTPTPKPLVQTLRFAQQSSKFTSQQFHPPPVRGVSFGASALPTISTPPRTAAGLSYQTNRNIDSMNLNGFNTNLSSALNGNFGGQQPLPQTPNKTLDPPNVSNTVGSLGSTSGNTPNSTTTTGTTTSSSSSTTSAIINTPIIPELLPFVGRTTAMINNISVWTGESGQQIPQTGLVMLQQQNNAVNSGNTGFLMASNGSSDTYASLALRQPSLSGTSAEISGLNQNGAVNPNGSNRNNGSGADYDQLLESSGSNGLDLLNNWSTYPNDEFWSVRNDMGFIP